MAEALAKLKDGKMRNCNTGDNDGLLAVALLEALATGARLDVGQYTESNYSPTNYTAGDGSPGDHIVDDHLGGIDNALGNLASSPHALGGSAHSADSLANLNAKVTGGNLDFDSASRPPSAHDLDSHASCTIAQLSADLTDGTLIDTGDSRLTDSRNPDGSASGDLSGTYPGPEVAKIRGYAVQDHAPLDGEVLKWVNGNSQYEPASSGGAPEAHDLDSHLSCTIAELSADLTDATLIDTADTRIPVQGENDALVGTSGTPSSSNKYVTNADSRNTNSRAPTGIATGDLGVNYPGPTVQKIQGRSVQSTAPTTKDILQWSGAAWNHVQGVAPNYDSGWFQVNYNTLNYVSKTHSIGTQPRQIQLFVSATNGGTAYLSGWSWIWGVEGSARGCIVRDITSTTLRVAVGSHSGSGVLDTYGQGGTRVTLGAGWARVYCWK